MHATTYELFEDCLATGTNETWEDFLARCGQKLRRILRAMLDRLADSLEGLELEDLEQDLYCRLLSAPRGFEGRSEGEVWGYLWRAVRSLLADRRRYLWADKRNGLRGNHDPVLLAELSPVRPDPERRLLAVDGVRELLECCARCFPRHRRPRVRQILHLILIDGCSSREVGARLGLTIRQVDGLMGRLRRRLKARGIDFPRRVSDRHRARAAVMVNSTP